MKSLHHVPAPAKLNLFLHITGRRPDGYHLLQSAFMLIDWCDVLHFDLTRSGQIEREDLTQPLPADDLIVRAARLLQKAGGVTQGAHVAIDKQLPAMAGMGGGSSDAAATLLALNRLWGLNWSRRRLSQLRLDTEFVELCSRRHRLGSALDSRLTGLTSTSATLVVLTPATIHFSLVRSKSHLPRAYCARRWHRRGMRGLLLLPKRRDLPSGFRRVQLVVELLHHQG